MKRDRRGGMALIITLVFVALITILVVGMSAAVLIDRPAAKSNFEKVRAMQFAQAGVDQVVAVLAQNIGQTNRYWVSGPGQLVVATGTNNILNSTNFLHSGAATSTLTGIYQQQALNLATFQDPSTYLITGLPDATGAVPAMQIAWVYVRRDGTLDTSTMPAINSNPIVGRYAYWTDDESSKVNLNLAWGRSAANTNASYGSPTMIDLTALTNMSAANASAIHSALTTNSYATLLGDFFNSPRDARRVGPAVSTVLSTNQFCTTFYNHDPDMSCLGTPRIVLTTQQSLAGGRPFLDVLVTPNTDPGNISNIDPAKVNTALFGSGGTQKAPVYPGLFWFMVNNKWPMAPGSTFANKYSTNAATALALNIIEYTRSKESTNAVVVPIRGFIAATGTFSAGTGVLHGRTRGPRITEMGLWLSATGSYVNPSRRFVYQAVSTIEVYLPPSYGLAKLDLTKMSELVQYTDGDGQYEPAGYNTNILANACSPSAIMTNGQYVTITQSLTNLTWSTNQTVLPPRPPGAMGMRAGLCWGANPNTNFVDLDPVGFASSNVMIPVPIDAATVPAASVTSTETDDPNADLNVADWTPHAAGGNTFGAVNSCSTLHKTQVNVTPQQDTEPFGQVSDASMVMPPPKGSMFTNAYGYFDDNTTGIVSSVGELGFVNTGVGFTTQNIPWRTLRLQPNNQATTVVPDWALLDAFTVPSLAATANTNASPILMPHATSVGGRVNINAGASSSPFALNRTAPLAAAFSGAAVSRTDATTASAVQAKVLAQNIYAGTLSTAGSSGGYNGKQYGTVSDYYATGQLAEISGVADQGESSEELLRQALNQLTTRGEVFTVYTIGQSLQQTSAGGLQVTGEERLQAIVERYLDATTSPAAVRFRTVYFQRLTP